jgi:hypothetical protein
MDQRVSASNVKISPDVIDQKIIDSVHNEVNRRSKSKSSKTIIGNKPKPDIKKESLISTPSISLSDNSQSGISGISSSSETNDLSASLSSGFRNQSSPDSSNVVNRFTHFSQPVNKQKEKKLKDKVLNDPTITADNDSFKRNNK